MEFYTAAALFGGMAEWSNAHAWKACKSAMASGVRIPLLPPEKSFKPKGPKTFFFWSSGTSNPSPGFDNKAKV